MTKIYEKRKKLDFGSILGSLGQFFKKIRFCHFFLFSDFYCAEFQKKLMNRIQQKLLTGIHIYWQTEKRSHG